MTDLKTITAHATVTLTVNGITETFTATVEAAGNPSSAAWAAIATVRDNASDWAGRPLREALGGQR